MKISIIVPIFGVEAYLPACIESVLCQTHRDFELILVDDGSPDNCGAICDGYARADRRVRVLHKQNGGAASARNAGLRLATGDYVLFLDGDDCWTDENALARLVSRTRERNADVLNFSYVRCFEDGRAEKPYFRAPDMPKLPDYAAQLAYLTARGLYIASACNKLLRRETIADLPFPEGKACEDIVWCAALLRKAQSMDFVCENFYHYRQRADSKCHSISEQTCKDLAASILACMELAHAAPEPQRSALLRYTAFQYATFFAVQSAAARVPTAAIAALKDCFSILRHHAGSPKLRLLFLLCRIFGVENTCKIIRNGGKLCRS